MVISLDVAKAQYRRNPTNDVYKPYSGGRFARIAYAIPCGTTTKPTVMPGELLAPSRPSTGRYITYQQ
jgi:hypothetical protein